MVQGAAALGLRYTLLRVSRGPISATAVDPDSIFHAGDRVQLLVESNGPGYLYVVSQGSTGAWSVLFPSNFLGDGSNRVEKGKVQTLPLVPGASWVFDEHPGTEKLLLILARNPLPDLNAVIYANGQLAATSVSDDLIREVQNEGSSRSQILAKSALGVDGKPERANYAVNSSAAAGAAVIVELTLRHE